MNLGHLLIVCFHELLQLWVLEFWRAGLEDRRVVSSDVLGDQVHVLAMRLLDFALTLLDLLLNRIHDQHLVFQRLVIRNLSVLEVLKVGRQIQDSIGLLALVFALLPHFGVAHQLFHFVAV